MQLNEKERAALEKQAGAGWLTSEIAAQRLIAHHLDRLATAAENIATTTQHISGTYDAIAKTLQGVAASEQPDWEARTPPQAVKVDVGPGGVDLSPVVDPDHYA